MSLWNHEIIDYSMGTITMETHEKQPSVQEFKSRLSGAVDIGEKPEDEKTCETQTVKHAKKMGQDQWFPRPRRVRMTTRPDAHRSFPPLPCPGRAENNADRLRRVMRVLPYIVPLRPSSGLPFDPSTEQERKKKKKKKKREPRTHVRGSSCSSRQQHEPPWLVPGHGCLGVFPDDQQHRRGG
ncbi:hypothetical protein BO70DRAFT_220496 [Aspergillus heteromorphus CBS 117.55]|uniref:Uncharacterized protein n=1 Tax=Aspergillus heteromorphus CBS 117.55 TaxID=1448321 RepID=A0A317WM26_9EURO|nr:uncharacterized protein BO70DRAFT_220496 [Aspergillus heteromorphus CBS 117.55]PWY86068.1 hypothetical protein BO70DRAFT_220496 [Aspergillus heteromorphus CBS 117.55]